MAGSTTEAVWRALRGVMDPEFPLNLVDLGMVYDVRVDPDAVRIALTFTSIGCPAIDMLVHDVKDAAGQAAGGLPVTVDVVWSPPWTKDKVSPKGRQVLAMYGVAC